MTGPILLVTVVTFLVLAAVARATDYLSKTFAGYQIALDTFEWGLVLLGGIGLAYWIAASIFALL